MADRPEPSREPVTTKAHALDILDGIASGVIVGLCVGGHTITPETARRAIWRQLKRAEKGRLAARAVNGP